MGGTVYFIGTGSGVDPDLLTLKGRRIIDSADIIVYDASQVNSGVLDGARPDAAVHETSMLDLQQAADIMIKTVRRGKTVARLYTGASLPYGSVAQQIALVQDAGVECLLVPGVSVPPELSPPRLSEQDSSGTMRAVAGSRREAAAVVALTRRGWHTGKRILDVFEDAELFLPARFRSGSHDRIHYYEKPGSLLDNLFQTRVQLVLIMAAGNAVRMLAPYICNTRHYPAVVTLDDSGRNIISLLPGHWGGANTLAKEIARILGGNPVLTTESDVMGFPAVDMLIRHLTGTLGAEEFHLFKRIQASILDGERVGFYPRDLETACNMQGHAHLHFYDSLDELAQGGCAAGLIVTHQQVAFSGSEDNFALVHPRDLAVGIDCLQGTAAEEIEKGVRTVFAKNNLCLQSIAAVCTADHNRDQDGLIEFAANMGVPLEFFSAVAINKVAVVPGESKTADGESMQALAQSAALLGSAGGGQLIANAALESLEIAVAARPLRQILKDSGADSDVC